MLRNILFFLIIFLSQANIGVGQTYTQTIRGQVVDADSKSPLPGASVVVNDAEPVIGAATDAEGKFRIEKVNVGRHTVKVSMLGFEEVTLNNLIVSSGKEVVITVELKEKVITAKEVEIVAEKDRTKANNELATISARSFQSEETNRYAGSRGDPSRMVANYAGVVSGNDARNDIIVRGNSPIGVLWRLEGVDIPNPNHFSAQGATGGPISMLNNNLLSNSDFLTGAFPAEYGNKQAAVFDLKLRNGNNEKFECIGQVGVNGLEFGVEGPLVKENGGSFLANYRYSTLDLFELMGIRFGVSGIPRYQDLSFKVNMPTGKAGIFSVWGLGGKSRIELKDSEKKDEDWSFTQSNEEITFGSDMGSGGFSHIYFYNSKTSGRLNVSLSANKFLALSDTITPTNERFRVFTNNSLEGMNHYNYNVTHKFNSRHLFKVGATYSNLFFDYNSNYYSRGLKKNIDITKENNNTGLVQTYFHWQFRITDLITFNNGLHYQQLLLNNDQALEPRSSFRWQFLPKHSFNLGYGLHSQTQPLVYYYYNTYNRQTDAYVQTNKDLKFSKSHHYIAGYDYNITKSIRLKWESYYQDLYNIPVEAGKPSTFSMINIGNDIEGMPLYDSLKNTGTGHNYGTELTIEKSFSDNFYFLTTTTLYNSKYKGSDMVEHYTAFSGGYVFNSLAGVEIPLGAKNKVLAFDGKFTRAGGNRFVPIDLAATQATGAIVYDDANAFTKKYKDYQKIDLKISFKMNQKKATQTWFIFIENITNRKNVLREVYDIKKNVTRTEYQLGLFPYGGYRIEF